MTLISPIKDHYFEKRLFVSRIILAVVISVLLLGTVVARLVQLQIRDYDFFAEKSQGNRVRIEALPPTRGLIFDRRGRILAENLPAYHSGDRNRTGERRRSSSPPRCGTGGPES